MSYSTVLLAKSPALSWPLGESSGTVAADESGNTFDGDIAGSPTLGVPGFTYGVTAVAFDGIDDRVVREGLGDVVPTTSALSVVVWINTTAMPPSWSWIYVVRGSSGTNPYMTLELTDTGALGLSLSPDASLNGYLDGPVVADGLQHQIVATWDNATELLILYVDGIEYDRTAALGVASPLPAFDQIGLGDWPVGAVDSPVDATLGQFSILPTALTAADVAELYAEAPVGPVEVETEVNRDGAIVFDNFAEARWSPAVVEPTVIEPAARVLALSYPAPTIDGTHLILDITETEEPSYRHRIVVGGHDITFWRDAPTPPMDFQRIQPLGHGTGTLRLPQAVVPFETPGVGGLAWLTKGAAVLSQSVDRETNEVVSTDWRGLVVAYDISGGVLTVECGGHAAGRAALQDRQMQLIQYRLDSGLAMAGAIRQLRLSHVPYYGPVTGISLIRWGGGGLLDYINELSAKMTTLDGGQWTTMPNEDGSYSTYLKDTETIHGTVYLDDTRISCNLRSDLAEEPNQIFASGVTPDGMVVKFGAYPGLTPGAAAPYPMNDNSSFGIGTTNAETDTGDGITVMGWRLNVSGLLDGRPSYVDYDAEMGEAIKDLKRAAKLSPVNSTMTKAAWAALFDISKTGYTLRGIRILPAAATSEITPWRLSANGSLIARNPGYVPSTIAVHRTIAMGAGFTRTQIRQWARHELGTGTQWRGTIEITTGAIVAGDHTPGDPVTSILRALDIWPGMNLSLPLFAGGIVVHVAGVSVTDEGRKVTLAVDTRPGDTLPVWAAIHRDRENSNTVHRSFFAQRRSSSFERENTFDEVGGRIPPIILTPDDWTVFPVVAKQAGTIEKLRLSLSPNREFVVAVFGRRISPARLRRVTNNPLSETGTKRWTSEAQHDALDRDHVLLYVAGSDEDPCGYSPRRKSDGGSLTGRWEDDASFPFVTFMNDTDRGSVLWVAVWVGASATVDGGRIMWPSAEEY